MFLPVTPQQLNRMLAWRLALGAVAVGFLAGTVAWLVESRRVEQAALENVSEAVRHFQSPAMSALSGENSIIGHEAMDLLLARSNLAAIRVFTPAGRPIYENWGGLSETIRYTLSAPTSPEAGGRVPIGGEELLRVVIPLIGNFREMHN